MELVALLGTDKESWGQVSALISHGTWDKVILVKTSNVADFPVPDNGILIELDSNKSVVELKKILMDKLQGKFSEFEASLSIASGNGKEHMALISALLSLPVGIRLVVYTKNGVEVIN